MPAMHCRGHGRESISSIAAPGETEAGQPTNPSSSATILERIRSAARSAARLSTSALSRISVESRWMVRAQARTDRRRQVRKLKELRAEVSWRIYGPVGLAARLVRKHIAQSLRVLRRAQQRAPAQHLLRRGLPTLISRAESTQSAVADLGSLRVAARMLSF